MKYKVVSLFIVPAIVLLLHAGSYSAVSGSLNVKINGQKVSCTMSPYMENGSLLLPVRELFELFGFDIKWDSHKKTAVCTRGSKKVVLREKSTTAQVDGNDIDLSIPVKITAGRFYVSAEAIQQGLGLTVDLAEDEGTVYLWNKSESDISISGNNNIIISGNNVLANITPKSGIDKSNKAIADADKLFSDRNYLGAVKSYEKILKSISSVKNPEEYSHVMVNMGNTYLELSCIINKEENSLKAISAFEEVINNVTGSAYASIYRSVTWANPSTPRA